MVGTRTAQPPRPMVIVLSGASSSGKSSLARALQDQLAEPAVLVEADRAFPVVPRSHERWTTDHAAGDVVVAFHRSVAAWPECGFHVIVDGSLPYEDRALRDVCLAVFEPYDLRVVGVTCAVEVLNEREVQRPDERPTGWAAQQARDIHDGMAYAAQVDTSTASPQECAAQVIAQLARATHP
ncbi:MAG TPA: AAA family ATPase [Actinopolymorphaceae bacterium]|nr:AAA family ATPase [Actinopolymorphaceae bacterium]